MLAAAFALAARSAGAAETASFLNIGAGAKGLAMGGAYTALADGADAVYWNPAGLAGQEKSEITASHAELFSGTHHDFLAFAQPTPQGTFAAGATYLSQSNIDGRDALGHPTAGFSASDAALALAFGRKTGSADLGASVKFVRSHIGSAEAQTAAADLGARRRFGAVTVGGSARNLGPGMKFDSETDDLPLRLALGAAYSFTGGHCAALELVNGPRGSGTDVGLGGEYQAIRSVFLRGGYTTQSAISGGSGFDAARGLTLGVGFRNERWSVDYAAVPMGELGSTHRFTLGARF